MLRLKGVTKVYEANGIRRAALQHISINFRKSEFAAILGPSGSGKTTLLNIIGGLDQYTRGDLVINGKSTKQFKDKDWDAYRNHRVGFVFQSYNLIPHQTVLQNVRLALTLSGVSRKDSVRRAKRALREVGLGEHMDKRPAQLSGGQMQRVAIARALVNDPDIVLADEPTGALDSETSLQIMEILKKVAKDRLVVMVTHNPELADEYATRIIKLKDGKITDDSEPYDEDKEAKEDASTAGRKKKHTKMSYLTALSLSLRNLLTKRTRTILIALAGSIGIVGIALISAVSAGFQNYIDTIEEDTLTSYPLTLMEESADLTGILLSVTGSADVADSNGKIKENQVLTGALGSVSHNDLASFMNYLDLHRSEVEEDVKLIEDEYNVDPLIYTVDATGELAKLNPTNLFSSLIGDTSLLNNYSSLTSVFQQRSLANMQEDAKLVVGRWPEKYDEIVISLANPNQIPDLMTYTLGFHDTSELNEILTKIMSGEAVDTKNEPLELTTEDLLSRDLRVIPTAEIYRYNDKYNVYEDMSEDEAFMWNLYNSERAEPLKIVGIITPDSSMTTMGNGIFYLPELTEHIIGMDAKTEIVQRQLANPELDVFANKPFGAEENNFDFEFSDLVTVDNEALQEAFGITIDQDAIMTRTQEYMGGIMADIDTGTGQVVSVREEIVGRFKQLADPLGEKFKQKYREELEPAVRDMIAEKFPKIMLEGDAAEREKLIKELVDGIEQKVGEILAGFVGEVGEEAAQQDYGEWEAKYGVPAESFKSMFASLLQYYAATYGAWWTFDQFEEILSTMPGLSGAWVGGALGADVGSSLGLPNFQEMLEQMKGGLEFNGLKLTIPTVATEYTPAQFLEENEIASTAMDGLSMGAGKAYLTKEILTKVGGLTSYLTSSFADTFHVDQDAMLGAFRLNFTEDELTRVISAMFNEKEVSLATNLSDMGYQDLEKPTRIAFYFDSFDGKTDFMAFLDNYNEQMRTAGEDEKVIDYSDSTGAMMSSVKVIVDAVSYVLIAFVSISLVVSSIMIGVITYISVYERKKEIGILRALGASKHNISSIFNAETFIIGLLAGLFGITISYLLIPLINAVLHHYTGDIPLNAMLAPATAVLLVILSVILTIIGGLIPAHSASKKDPVEALRSE